MPKTLTMIDPRPNGSGGQYERGQTYTLADDLADYFLSIGVARYPTLQQTQVLADRDPATGEVSTIGTGRDPLGAPVVAVTSPGGGVVLSAPGAVPSQMLGSVLYAQRQHPGYLPADGSVVSRSQYPGLRATIGTELDGLSDWTSKQVAGQQWRSIAWSPELEMYCAVSANGAQQIMTSPDGDTWTLVTAPVVASWVSVAWSSELGMWCAVAYNGAAQRIMTSPDGVTWTARWIATPVALGKVVWAKELGLWCAVSYSGEGPRVITSPDGINWDAQTAPAGEWRALAWSPKLGLLVAVASTTSNRAMWSRDGKTWVLSTLPGSNGYWRAIEWSPDLEMFCALASGGTMSRVAYSYDGKTWLSATLPAIAAWTAIAWSADAGVWCIVAESGDATVATSPDGLVWTTQTPAPSGAASGWQAIAWSPKNQAFVSVASSGNPINSMRCFPAVAYSAATHFKLPTIAAPVGTARAFIFAGV